MEKITVKQAREEYKINNGKIIDDSVNGFVVLNDVDKIYNNRVQAVFRFNLSISQNEFIVLVGPSGCGKSTTLRMIAGLEEITKGKLYIDNVYANYLPSKDRDIAMVFQSYALYPNMSVYDNMGFGLQTRGMDKEEIKRRVFNAAEILDLGPYLDRKPKELSGGQMQRVALGRAIVRDAKLFLMDEPLSNLDAKLRVQMRSEIVKLHRRLKTTTIYVTHDQTEAMTMADRIVIMNQGIVQQIGTPIQIYNNPANVFVATFIGNPPMNVFNMDITSGKLTHKDKDIVLSNKLVDTYIKFIEEKKQFFKDLKEKSDLTKEKQVLAKLVLIRKSLRAKLKGNLKGEMEEILDEILELSKKGFIRFSQKDKENILEDISLLDKRTIKKHILELEEIITSSDLAIAGILKEHDSAASFFAQKQNVEKKEKTNETLSQENERKINEYIEKYNDEKTLKNALVGIRPEDITFAKDSQKDQFIETEAELVELLGSDFCMHSNIFNTNLIVKRPISEVVESGQKVKLTFDLSKLKIFDPISGKTINCDE